MDKLRTEAPFFYTGTVAYRKLRETTHMNLDNAGQALLKEACKREAIAQAKKHSYLRRVYENAYLNRSDDGKKIYLSDFDQLGARWVKDAIEISNPRDCHTGYYTDDFCHNTISGVVLCFTRHGAPDQYGEEQGTSKRKIYMAGTQHSDWDGVTLDVDTTDCIDTAARWADRMAEREAEECREQRSEDLREQRSEDLRSDIKSARQKCLQLLRDMRPLRKGLHDFPESVCQALRDQVQEYCETIAGYRKELGELT